MSTLQHRSRAMGTEVHLIIDGAPQLLVAAVDRIADLERRWSRFLVDSEVSRLNRGESTYISPDTERLLECSAEGFERSGLFNPYQLDRLAELGYDRSFDDGLDCDVSPVPGDRPATSGAGFDPGGLGKGLAADIVAREVVAQGATAALVNIGGDIAVAGQAPEHGWEIRVDEPEEFQAICDLHLSAGGLATSSIRKRVWTVSGQHRHHVIDPRTAEPADGSGWPHLVTAVCAFAWQAEVVATHRLLGGLGAPFPADVVELFDDGRVEHHSIEDRATKPGASSLVTQGAKG